VYRLGDRVKVQVVRVDLERRQIDLGLSEILNAVRASPRKGGRAPRSEVRPKHGQRPPRPRDGGRKRREGRRERQQRRGRK
jgi:transcriptional accessory protein Tex/SPT6